jgi:hypothetical protein
MKASTGAYLGAALFVMLMIAFATVGDGPPSAAVMATIGLLGVTSHLVLLPVVSASGSTSWARACGYSWIAIDVMLNVAGINGAALATLMPLRLGGHVLAALWIGDAALASGGVVAAVGMVLAALLGGHAVTAPWIPPWVIFLPFMMIPVFLVLIGRAIERAPVDGHTRAAVARQVT